MMDTKRFSIRVLFGLLIVLMGQSAFTLSHAQNNRHAKRVALGANLILGKPFSSVENDEAQGLSVDFTFVPFKLISGVAKVSIGQMSGDGYINQIIRERDAVGAFSYKTVYTSAEVMMLFNLHRLFLKNRRPQQFIPYFFAGIGRFYTDAVSTSAGADKTYNQRYYVQSFGLMGRFKINRQWDAIGRLTYYRTETYYLDAIPLTSGYDGLLTLEMGLSFKLGTWMRRSDFIDWRRMDVIVRCPRYF